MRVVGVSGDETVRYPPGQGRLMDAYFRFDTRILIPLFG